ncbi:hypothetical protein [Gymnodinialimonas sp. 57CJ19]|uniref:hypothetical protein n=1 Tax=Gymnodinialimonas sp. 57CJ19 TaxID=3138498 RepID=UPI0031342FF1
MTDEHNKDPLEALFAEAKADGFGPDLMARVLADAEAVQGINAASVPIVRDGSGATWWAGLLGVLGGWSAVSGITAAGVMGLAVGLYSPDTVSGLLDGPSLSFGTDALEMTPDMADFWTEDGDV